MEKPLHVQILQDNLPNCQRRSDRLILIALASFANLEGMTWPSIRTLQQRTKLSRSTIHTSLRRCVDEGHLIRINNDSTPSNTYQFTLLKDAPMKLRSIQGGKIGPEEYNIYNSLQDNKDKGSVLQVTNERPLITQNETDFDLFWKLYPRKVAKGYARLAYKKALKITSHAVIMNGLHHFLSYIEHTKPEPQFIPHPSTWLHQERWDDEHILPATTTTMLKDILG